MTPKELYDTAIIPSCRLLSSAMRSGADKSLKPYQHKSFLQLKIAYGLS